MMPALPAWPLVVVSLLLATVGLVVGQMVASRPRFPPTAPRRLPIWPVFGCLDFFRSRCDFLLRGRALDLSGQFSFYYGPHPIVAVSGSAAQSSFYNARRLDLGAGFAGLFAAVPVVGNVTRGADSLAPFLAMLRHSLQKDQLEAKLAHVVGDTDAAPARVDVSRGLDPFGFMLRLIYQMTHRTVGCDDVANDAKLLRDTLATFGRLDNSSALEVMFPSLVMPNKLKKVVAGLRLHRVFAKIVRNRRRTGHKATDAMQILVDQDLGEAAISMTMISSLFAGLINSTFNAAWILCFLADNATWYGRVQVEVDAFVAQHRRDEDRTAADTLARLSLAQWESCFPVIGVCLRETIRLSGRGASMCKNVSGKFSTAMFFARFAFARCNKAGRDTTEPTPTVDRRGIGEKWPERDIFLC